MTIETIFSKIINRQIAADIVYETESVLAFKDISPQAPVHILIIPKKNIVNLLSATEDDSETLAKLMLATQEVARILQIDAYRVVINNGAKVGQTVFHLHLHLLAGREFDWPPG